MSVRTTTKHICDRCGKKIRPDARIAKLKVQEKVPEKEWGIFEKIKLRWTLCDERMEEKEKELCGDCSHDLFDWWHKVGKFREVR